MPISFWKKVSRTFVLVCVKPKYDDCLEDTIVLLLNSNYDMLRFINQIGDNDLNF